MRSYIILLLEQIKRWLLLIVIIFGNFGCVSNAKSDAKESDCNVKEIFGNFKHRDLLTLRLEHNEKRITEISLNNPDMTLETAVNLGHFVRERNISISLVGNNTCDDECPIPYLMAKKRYARSDIEFPKYSVEEREWLKEKGQNYFKTTYSKAQILELINYNFRGTKLQIVEDQAQLIDIIKYNNWTPECEN